MRTLAAKTSCFLIFASLTVTGAGKVPKVGVQTPGIQVAMADLKSDADIPLPGPAQTIAVADTVWVASAAKNVLVRVDAKSNKTENIEGVQKPCGGVVSAFGSIWVPGCGDGSLARIDPKTRQVTATVPVSVAAGENVIVSSPDSLWMLSDNRTTLSRVDPDSNIVVSELRLPAGCNSLLFAETALWVTCPKLDKVLRVDPATNLVVSRIEAAAQPGSSAAGEGSIWVLCRKDGKVARIDPKTNKVSTTIELNIPNADGNIAFGEGSVWVSSTGFPISRIDPATDKVAQQFAGPGGNRIIAGAGSIWLTASQGTTLVKLDPKRIRAVLAP